MQTRVHVLGAGIVGICCAIELCRRGCEVVLIDRGPPGGETSYGNAGVIAAGSVTPEADPAIWRHLAEHLGNRGADVHLHYRQLPRMLPYLWRFLRNALPHTFRANSAHLHALLDRAVQTHQRLVDECGAGELLRRRGWLKLYRSERALAASRELERLLDALGIEYTRLDRAAVAELEPHLEAVFAGGRWMTGAASISDPGELAARYTERFRAAGGRVERREVRAIEPRPGGWRIRCDDAPIDAEQVVVALGAWSRALLAPLGYRMPLIAERGYHRHFLPEQGTTLNRPIHDIEAGYVLAPMAMGHRLTSGVEWAALGAPPTPVQLERIIPRAREAFPLGEASGETWLGNRPQTPDSLPAIGPIPGHHHLWLATGHGHLGLSLAPITGILIAHHILGQATDIDTTPYLPARFA